MAFDRDTDREFNREALRDAGGQWGAEDGYGADGYGADGYGDGYGDGLG